MSAICAQGAHFQCILLHGDSMRNTPLRLKVPHMEHEWLSEKTVFGGRIMPRLVKYFQKSAIVESCGRTVNVSKINGGL